MSDIENRGSEWNRWDLHIHAPTSAKNNNFSTTLGEQKISGNQEKVWEAYISHIEKLPPEVKVLGITDYYSIDGYIKAKEYKEKGRLENIELLIPNMELRLSEFTTGGEPVNIHILFSPSTKIVDIQKTFNNIQDMSKKDIQEMDQSYIQNNNPIVSIDSLESYIFHLKEKNIDFLIIVSGREDGISGLIREPQNKTSVATRVLKLSHFIFSSNENDKKFYLGKHSDYTPDKFVEKFDSLKPCIHGSDAHDINKICEPDQKRYCWLKAKPNFEGLKQLLCDPEGRVHIGEIQPKLPKETLQITQITDENGNNLYLNPNLNVIIGSRSSGKSFLLSRIAEKSEKGIINKQFKKMEILEQGIRLNSKIDQFDFKVHWGDEINTLGDRKILYIPQNFLNHLDEESDEIQTIITKYIEGNDEFSLEYENIMSQYDNTMHQIKMSIDNTIDAYAANARELYSATESLKKYPPESALNKRIEVLDKEISSIREKSDMSDEKMQEYKNTLAEKSVIEDELSKIKNNIETLKKDKDNIPNSASIKAIKEHFTPILSDTGVSNLDKTIEIFQNGLEKVISDEINALYVEQKNKTKLQEEINKKIIGYSAMLKNNELLTAKLKDNEGYSNDLKERTIIQNSVSQLNVDQKKLCHEIKENFKKYKIDSEGVCEKINGLLRNDSNEVKISVKIIVDEQLFIDNQDYFKPTKQENNFSEKIINIENIDELLNKDNSDLKSKYTADNVYNTAKNILSAPYKVHYDVMEDDQLLTSEMSVGQRSITMLKLLVEFSNEKYPILLDQPEDDLDNEAIYKKMVQFIKKKKRERQFIVVTHNANVVLGGDAENVIICSRDGKKYSIINDSIEEPFVRERICKLLEGGKEAFKKREKQYIGLKWE